MRDCHKCLGVFLVSAGLHIHASFKLSSMAVCNVVSCQLETV